ncbi:MAG: hypothetical protein WA705_09880 [Candidatus Ozemobacteraceae bacterium]
MRNLLVILFLATFIPATLFAVPATATFNVAMVDMIRYEAGLASSAQKPSELLRLSFGAGDANIGGCDQDLEHRTEGVPYAYIPLADGSVWVLDSIQAKIKRFSPDGKLMATVPIKNHGDAVKPFIRDFALAPKDGFYLLCVTDGKVERISATGEQVVEIEGLNDTLAIGSDCKGNVLVRNNMLKGILRFNPEGELVERYEDQTDLSEYSDLEGRPYGVRGDDLNAVVFKTKTASPVEELELAKFPLELPKDRGAHYVSRKILGVDAAQNIYVELVACDDDGVIHQNQIVKLSPTGTILSKTEMISSPYIAVDLPRRLTVMPDGRVMGFSVDPKGWALVFYKLP